MECDKTKLPVLALMGIVVHKVMNRAKEMYMEFDLNYSQAGVLFYLHQKKEMSQKELAARLNMTPPSVTSTIQKMEKGGYITRKPDETDQRVMRLALTEKGESCIHNVKEITDQMEELIFSGMNTEEKLLFRRLLIQVGENLDEERKKSKTHAESYDTERKNRL